MRSTKRDMRAICRNDSVIACWRSAVVTGCPSAFRISMFMA
ncbi:MULTISPECIES: hypothetical protein [Methylobacterium]|nr:hypothetical protein [Methylobacterium tardum]